MSLADHILAQRREKVQEFRQGGLDPFSNRFAPSHTIAQVMEKYGTLTGPELEKLNATFRLAGRLMLVRKFGKAIFCHFQDGTGRLQAYVQREVLGTRPSVGSRSWTSAILWALRGRSFAPKPRNSPWR